MCQCICGLKKAVSRKNVRSGLSSNCGCLRRKTTTHGYSKTQVYRCWKSVMFRCGASTEIKTKYYSQRGIKICSRWAASFLNFLEDMGEPPKNHSIERLDVNGNYEPKNCVWLPNSLQSKNTRRNVFFTHNGETKCKKDWAILFGVSPHTIEYRLKSGYSFDDVVKEFTTNQSNPRRRK